MEWEEKEEGKVMMIRGGRGMQWRVGIKKWKSNDGREGKGESSAGEGERVERGRLNVKGGKREEKKG